MILKITKITQLCILICFFYTHNSGYRINFNKENWRYYNYRGIRKQENQSECGNNSSSKCFHKDNALGDIELETADEKRRNGLFDCCLKLFPEILNSFNSLFDKNLLETPKHSYCLQNNELTKF